VDKERIVRKLILPTVDRSNYNCT